jgi:hypothetical protein
MCVYACAWTCVCMHVHVCICMCMCVYACACACVSMYNVCMCMCMYMCVWTGGVLQEVHAHYITQKHIYQNAPLYAPVHTHWNVSYASSFTHKHTHTQTHAHTKTYLFVPPRKLGRPHSSLDGCCSLVLSDPHQFLKCLVGAEHNSGNPVPLGTRSVSVLWCTSASEYI